MLPFGCHLWFAMVSHVYNIYTCQSLNSGVQLYSNYPREFVTGWKLHPLWGNHNWLLCILCITYFYVLSLFMAENKFACSGSCDLLKSWGSLLMLWDRNQTVWESEIQTAYSLGQWHLCSPLSSVSGFNHSVFKDYRALNHCTGTLWLAAVGWMAAWHSVGGCGQGIKPLMLAWPLKGGERGHLPLHSLLSTMASFSQLPAAVESKGGWNHPVRQFHLPLIAWHFSQSCAGHVQHYVDMSGTILHLVCERTTICQFSWNNSFQFVMAMFWEDCWSVRLILLTPCSLGLFFLCYSSRILLVYNYYSLCFFKKGSVQASW